MIIIFFTKRYRMKQYRIKWKELNGTVQGHGAWHDSKKLLEQNILYYNDKHKGEIHYWLQTK